jgi:3-hydroxyacyl-CoA dehydrogenase/enoyl-CoA hydratase/3-hydroxybutyryl-CoA epimerase
MLTEDYLTVEIADGVATVWMDQKNEKINKVSADLVACFDAVLEPLANDSQVKAIVMMSKKKDFIAGADIEMFQKALTPGDIKPLTLEGHKYLNKIADFKKPVVAAIHKTKYKHKNTSQGHKRRQRSPKII